MATQTFGARTPIVAPSSPRPSTPSSGGGTSTLVIDPGTDPTTGAALTPPAATSTPAATAPSTDPTTTTDNQNGANATATITSTLDSLGLGGMIGWATTLAYSLAGQGIDPSSIINTITSQLNNPTNSDGSVNTDALTAFNTAMPGFNQRIAATGNNGSPGASPADAIAAYISYGTQVAQFAQQAGLVPGTIDATTIGNLWSSNVSSSEVSQRITDASVAANSAPKEVQDYLANNFGMSSGTLTSYYLNPQNTLATITSNTNAGYVGGEAAITGFDKNLTVAQAQTLGAFLANGSSAGSSSQVGQVGQVTAGQANNFFTGNLSSATNGQVTGSLAQLAGMETALPGQSASGSATENTLLSAAQGNAAAIAETSNAQQARTAAGKGGGGAVTTANGAEGLGYAQS